MATAVRGRGLGGVFSLFGSVDGGSRRHYATVTVTDEDVTLLALVDEGVTGLVLVDENVTGLALVDEGVTGLALVDEDVTMLALEVDA